MPYKLGGEIWQSDCYEYIIHCIGMTEAFENRQYYFKLSSQNYKHLLDLKYLLTFACQISKQKGKQNMNLLMSLAGVLGC